MYKDILHQPYKLCKHVIVLVCVNEINGKNVTFDDLFVYI